MKSVAEIVRAALMCFVISILLAARSVPAQDAQDSRIEAQHLRDLLDSGEYDTLEKHFAQRLDRALSSLADYRALHRDLETLAASTPATLVAFDGWVLRSNNGISRLVRAEFRSHRAWLARGDKFSHLTHKDNFIRMQHLMALARDDYASARAMLGNRCDVCLSGLLEAFMLEGDRSRGAALVDAAMHDMAGGMATPLNYLRFLHPRWGGSWEEMERFVNRFAADFPQAPGVPLLRGVLMAHQADAWLEAGDVQRAILLQTEALRIDPGNGYLWRRLTAAALAADNAELGLRASEEALIINPQAIDALTARASFLLRGKQPLEAVPLLERAVAMGSDWALQALLPIVAAGQHGFKPDHERARRICQSAIDAQLPSGFACMGGLHFFGSGRPADKPQALHWFAEAADRGVASAMVDAGLMLWRGDGVATNAERAVDYWLRAHEAGEPRADALLKSHLSPWTYWWRVTLPGLRSACAAMLDDLARSLRLTIQVA